tara:strand:- start:453593 stop:453784 length:192 start_codon:yes stop_codon:yes gene_type:complete
MKFTTVMATTAAVLMLGACAEKESEEGIIPQGYKSAVEKAQGVEGKLQETMQMHGEEMDEGEH